MKPERKGGPRKISVRSGRKLLRALKTLSSLNQNTTIEKVVTRSGFKTSTLQAEEHFQDALIQMVILTCKLERKG